MQKHSRFVRIGYLSAGVFLGVGLLKDATQSMRHYAYLFYFVNIASEKPLYYNDLMAKEPQLYEIGLLIKPGLSEAEASAELGNVRLEIEKHSGILERTTDPKLRKLSYPIKKISQAYFAALQFSVSPASITEIEKTVSSHPHVLRCLVLSWTRAPAETVLRKPMRTRTQEPVTSLLSPARAKEPVEKVDEKELDKKLDEILGK